MRSFPIPAQDLHDALAPDGWFGHETQPRFAGLATAPAGVPEADVGRFFEARGLALADAGALALARALVASDLRAIAHGLSLLHAEEVERTALSVLPDAARAALAADPPRLDHVGVELFGRLEWYIEALGAWAARGGLRLSRHRIFPSVQVRRALAHDPRLAGVRIARIHLRRGGHSVNLELFEAGQHWRYTAARQLALFCHRPRRGAEALAQELGRGLALPLDPVGHLALRVERWRTVESVHRILAGRVGGAGATRLYEQELSYNAEDESLNSKILATTGSLAGAPVFGRIVELISYGVRGDPRACPRPCAGDASAREGPPPAPRPG